MNQLIQGLIAKVGLNEEQAKAVFAFLQEHADSLPALLAQSGLASKVPGMLGGLMGGQDDGDAETTSPDLSRLFG